MLEIVQEEPEAAEAAKEAKAEPEAAEPAWVPDDTDRITDEGEVNGFVSHKNQKSKDKKSDNKESNSSTQSPEKE